GQRPPPRKACRRPAGCRRVHPRRSGQIALGTIPCGADRAGPYQSAGFTLLPVRARVSAVSWHRHILQAELVGIMGDAPGAERNLEVVLRCVELPPGVESAGAEREVAAAQFA